MRTWEIINPSDDLYIDGEPAAVAAAMLLVGRGHYAVTDPETGYAALPLLMFGAPYGLGADEWFEQEHGVAIGDALKMPETIAALDSVRIGREPYCESEGRYTLHDQLRTSCNDIARTAWKWADQLRAKAERRDSVPTTETSDG